MTVLFDNISADAVSTPYQGNGSDISVVIYADDFGGGTVYAEIREAIDTAPWIPIIDPTINGPISVIQNSVFQFALPLGVQFRLRFGGSLGASNLRASVFS